MANNYTSKQANISTNPRHGFQEHAQFQTTFNHSSSQAVNNRAMYRSCLYNVGMPKVPTKTFDSVSLQRQCGLDNKVNTSTAERSYPTRDRRKSINSAVRRLPWRMSEYDVSPCHCFSSTTPKSLDSKICQMLLEQKVSFQVDQTDSLCYVCEKSVQGTVHRFKIYVSSLLKSCQELLGANLLIEITKNGSVGASMPLSWKRLKDQILSGISDEAENPKLGTEAESYDSDVEYKLLNKESKVEKREKREDRRKPYHGIHLDPTAAFIDFYKHVEPNVENEEVAVTLSQMVIEMSKHEEQQLVLDQEGWNTLLAMLSKGSNRFKTAAFTILFNKIQFCKNEIEQKYFEQVKSQLTHMLVADECKNSATLVCMLLETLDLLNKMS